MRYEEQTWKCADGEAMFACQWLPDEGQPVKAVVGLVHGMGEHMGRYGHVAGMLVDIGCMVIGFDQRGHGRTEGKRGHTPSYEALLEGVDLLIAEARRTYPGAPLFLYGHSMGGNVTLNYLLRRQPDIAGAIVTGPWLKLAFKTPTLQTVIGRVVEKIYPQYTNNRPLNANHLTSDPAMIERFRSDPLGHGHITAKFFFSIQRAGLWALQHAGELRVPTLLMHATDDSVTSAQASKQFAESAGGICRWIGWQAFRHELHNETGREDVFEVIRQWIAERTT